MTNIAEKNSRSLSFIETYCKIANDTTGGYNLITLNKIIYTPIFTPEKIYQAIDFLLEKYSILNAYFYQDAAGILSISSTKQNTPEDIATIYNGSVDSIQNHINELLKLNFSNKKLWRMRIIIDKNSDCHYILLSLHHSILDGLSAVKLITAFLNACGHNPTLSEPMTIPILPPIESTFPSQTGTVKFLLKSILKNSWLTLMGRKKIPYESSNLNSLETHYLFEKIEEYQLKNLIAYCKKNEITLTALLYGILSEAILKSKGIYKKIKLLSTIPTSPLKGATSESLGCFIIPFEIVNQLNPALSFTQIGDHFKKLLNLCLKKPNIFPSHFSATPFIQKILLSELKKKNHTFKYYCQLSNLGKIDHLVDSSLKEFYFFTSRTNGDVLLSLYTATFNNTLFLTFAYPFPILKRETAELIVNNFNLLINSVSAKD